MKKNVLQLIGSFNSGGSERQAVQLARLFKDDDSVNLNVATLNREGPLLPEIEKLALTEIPEFPLTSFYDAGFFRQAARFARMMRDKKIDVVHTHDFYTNVFGMFASSLARVPRRIASKRETDGMRTEMQKRVEKIAYRGAAKIVANSESVKSYLISRNITESKIEVIYNGVDLVRLEPSLSDRSVICSALNLPSDPKIRFVTMVANMRHPVKNQTMLLRSAKRLAESFPDVHFVFAGEGELVESYKGIARELELTHSSHFIGLCSIVPELLSVSYACVLSSESEGFSNSILEYMAAAKPVVATDVGGAAEAILDAETGYLVTSNDDLAMADKLADLLSDPHRAEEFGRKGRSRIEREFSMESQLRKTKKLYGIGSIS